MVKDQETEEDRREEEAEVVTEGEMEQQAGDKEEARGDMDLLKLWELIKEDSKKQKEANNENFKRMEENSRKQNEALSENLIKQMEERFDKNKEETNENFRKQNENNRLINEKIDSIKGSTSETLRQTINENNEQLKADFRQINEKIDSSNESTREEFRKLHEKIDSINGRIDKINDNTDEKIKNINETISQRVDQTREELIGFKEEVTTRVNNIEINNKISVTEIQAETQGKLDEVQINRAGRIERVHNEMKTMKIRQTRKRKLINTWEGLEMIKGGLVKTHNIPITEPREVRQFRNSKRTTIEFLERDVYKRQMYCIMLNVFTLNN